MKRCELTSCLATTAVAGSGAGWAQSDEAAKRLEKLAAMKSLRGLFTLPQRITAVFPHPGPLPPKGGEGKPSSAPRTSAPRTSAPRNDDAAALARHLEHQLVHSTHEPRRILELPAFCEERLVEQEVAPVGEARLFLVQALHHRMRRIDFEDRLGLGRF